MVALQIRDVPEGVRSVLAEQARSRGQSLQAFLLSLVEEEAGRCHNLAILRRFSARSDGSTMSAAGALESLDNARAERDAHLDAAASGASVPGIVASTTG